MKCPKCKKDTRVIETKKLTNVVIRIRKCPSCGHIFETEEKHGEIR